MFFCDRNAQKSLFEKDHNWKKIQFSRLQTLKSNSSLTRQSSYGFRCESLHVGSLEKKTLTVSLITNYIWYNPYFYVLYWSPWYNYMNQGYNARKVISKVCASFVLHELSLGGNVNTRRMSQPYMGSIFHIKNQYSGLRELLCELSKFSKLNAFILLGY